MTKAIQSPGAFLTHLIEKHKLNPFKLSKEIHLSQSAVRLIALGETRITVPVAMRLAKYFNTNPEFWLAMQMKWDLALAAKDRELTNIVRSISRFKKEPAAGKKPAAKKTAGKKAAAKKPASNRAKIAKKQVARKKASAKAAKKPASKKPASKKPASRTPKKAARRTRRAK